MSAVLAEVGALDAAASAYVDAVLARLRAILGDELVALYVVGSGALGDWNAESSDVDLVAVVAHPPARSVKEALVAALRQQALPVRAKALELIVYAEGAGPPEFELNFNTGPGLAEHVAFEPGLDSPHWFVVDASIAEGTANSVFGPPWGELFAPVAAGRVRQALAVGLEWTGREEPTRKDTVRNAVRALRYAEEGAWSSKPAAVEWARGRGVDLSLLDEPEPLDPERVRTLLARVREALR